MKKIVYIGKVLLLTILFVIGIAYRSFAAIEPYVTPTKGVIVVIPFLGVILAVLCVISVIALVFLLVAKIKKSEELLSKSKNICENLLYYILVVIGLIAATYALSELLILGILPLIDVFVSLFLRLKSKNKKASYMVLGIYLVLILRVLYPGVGHLPLA